MDAPPDTPTPTTQATIALRARLSPTRWVEVEAHARECARILEQVTARYRAGVSWRRALKEVAPDVQWPTFLSWRRREASREGTAWERQLDARVAPEPKRVDALVVAAACTLRQVMPTMTCVDARDHLVRQFGEEQGGVSDATLKRIWKGAGLAQPPGGHLQKQRDNVWYFHGGAGLALLMAVTVETGAVDALAKAVLEATQQTVAGQPRPRPIVVEPGSDLRDERGRFTGDYNRAITRADGSDPRWVSDARKRERRELSKLAVASSSETTVASKFLAMGITSLLTERRGFDGLEGPTGAWLSVLGGTAYQPSTLDKFLSELALANVGDALWRTHARQWAELTAQWRSAPGEPHWLGWAVYVDATQDPYWTRSFASAGKVSRVNRTMPCLTRVAVMGGPGVPLVIETHAGSVSLKTTLLPCLDRVEAAVGPGELGRLIVMDAEMGTVPLMSALAAREDGWFVTVLKGSTAKAARHGEAGPWQGYRERDLIREVSLRFEGGNAPEEGLDLRGVEMIREGSRNAVTTLFATNAPAEELSLAEVPTSYLSRWPHQERRFRDGRNGLGLDKSHGYGGGDVAHVALLTATDKANKRVERGRTRVANAEQVERTARDLLDATPRGGRAAAQASLRTAAAAVRQARKSLAANESQQAKLASTPRAIYVRDTTRDSIATVAKMTVLMLLEFALKEYFAGLRMEVRTFIEAFMHLPVTVRERRHELVYELHENARSPQQSEWLRQACAEITRRELRRGKRRLRFVAVGPG